MPWNDNSKPGPWGAPPPQGGSGGGGGPRRPRGPGLGGGSGRPPGGPGPDLEEIGRRLNDMARQFFYGRDGKIRSSAILAVAGVAVGVWALSGIYVVRPDEEAVVTTLGAYTRSETPGLRYHLPAPIERVRKVSITSLRRLDVGGGEGAESLMLTGDENIVDLSFTVQWRIADADQYLFAIRDSDGLDDTVRDVAESAMREVVGQTTLQAILTTGRVKVEQQVETLMRQTLRQYGAGIDIVEVQIQGRPPEQVGEAFRQVASARQEAESAVNEANAYRNRVVNEAKGDGARITQSAAGYREQAIREAEGDAARFSQLYEEYRRAPGVTRERLYLETMERVLQKSKKVIVDGENTSAPIILPPEAFRAQGQAAPSRAVVTAPQSIAGAGSQGGGQ